MRNPCPPSTCRQNELQRRAKAHLALRPRKGDFKQHKSSLGNCVVSNPTPFHFSLITLPLTPTQLPLLLVLLSIFSGGTWLQGATTTPHLPSFPLKTTHKPHYYQPHLNPPTFSPLVCLFYANSVGFLWGFQPHLIMTQFHPLYHLPHPPYILPPSPSLLLSTTLIPSSNLSFSPFLSPSLPPHSSSSHQPSIHLPFIIIHHVLIIWLGLLLCKLLLLSNTLFYVSYIHSCIIHAFLILRIW